MNLPAVLAAVLLPASLAFAASGASLNPKEAVAASATDADLLGTDANGDGVRDDLGAFLRSISEDDAIEASLVFMAKARTQAMRTDPNDGAAVKSAFDQVFAAKGCLSRDIGEYLYQQSLTFHLESALLNNQKRSMAMRRAMEADRGNVRAPAKDGQPDCPLPANPDDVASYMTTTEVPGLDGTPVKVRVYYARPSMVVASQDDTDLLGIDADKDGVRDDLQGYLRLVSQDPVVTRALAFKAQIDTMAMLTDPSNTDAVRTAWQKQIEAHACVTRDIHQRKQRYKLTRRLDLHLLNTAPRAVAMRSINQAMRGLAQDAQAIAGIRCGLPEAPSS